MKERESIEGAKAAECFEEGMKALPHIARHLSLSRRIETNQCENLQTISAPEVCLGSRESSLEI